MWIETSPNPRRILNTQGFVLHQKPYSETSSLVDIFTWEYGSLRVLAKGVRKNKTTARLQAFTLLSLSWSGRGQLPVLTQAETLGECYLLSGDALYCGFYLNELLLNLLPPGDPHPAIFEAYQHILTQLSQAGKLESLLRYFELFLLESLGYGLSLNTNGDTHTAVQSDKFYCYEPEQGLKEAAQVTPHTLHGNTLLALQNRTLQSEVELREAKRLMRRLIQHYTNGKPIRSRDLFRSRSPHTQSP